MQKVDMTLLFKSFALCGLLLGSMISQVFCEEPADATVVDVDVPKSKEVTFTKADLVSAINGLGLKYTQTQYDYASELCPSSTTAISNYSPKIDRDKVVFYLPKNTKFENYLTGTIDSLKATLYQASSKHADYTTKFQIANVLYTDFRDFLNKFKFSGKKFVRKATTETGFDFNGDNFRDKITVRLSGDLEKVFESVQQKIDSKNIVTKEAAIKAVMDAISTPATPQDTLVSIKNLFEKFGKLKKPAEGATDKLIKNLGGMSMFSGKDAVNFADFAEYYGKFLIKFIEINPEIESYFEFLSASVKKSNPESNIKKVLNKDEPDFKKSIEKFITSSMDNDFSKETLKKDEFNATINGKLPKQVDFNVTEADIADSFLKLNIPNVDGSDTDILKAYLDSLKNEKVFDNLKGLKIENVLNAFFLLVKNEDNINKYFDAHPKSMNKPDDEPKDEPDDEPKDDEQQKEQQQDKQQEQHREQHQENQKQQEQQENEQKQNVQQPTGDNTQGDQSNPFQVTVPTKSNSKNLWLKLTLSISGFFLLVVGSFGGYVLIKHIKSKRASEESQVVV